MPHADVAKQICSDVRDTRASFILTRRSLERTRSSCSVESAGLKWGKLGVTTSQCSCLHSRSQAFSLPGKPACKLDDERCSRSAIPLNVFVMSFIAHSASRPGRLDDADATMHEGGDEESGGDSSSSPVGSGEADRPERTESPPVLQQVRLGIGEYHFARILKRGSLRQSFCLLYHRPQ